MSMQYDMMQLALHARLNTLRARGDALRQGLLIADAVMAGGGSSGRAIAEAVRAAKRCMKLEKGAGDV